MEYVSGLPKCDDCGDVFRSISSHWSKSSCDYPELSDDTKSVLRGCLAGDGSIDKRGKFTLYTSNPTFANFFYTTIEKSLPPSIYIVEEDYTELSNREQYHISLPVHKFFKSERSRWYSSGRKAIPRDVDIGSLFMKFWYAGDGNMNLTTSPQASITMSNEVETDTLQEQLSDHPYEFYINNVGNTHLSDEDRYRLYISSKDNVKKFLRFLGEPVPGFEYKWVLKREKQKELYQDVYQKI